MTLYAISDLHVHYARNREFVLALHPPLRDDWLIVAGDVGESERDVAFVFEALSARFAKLFWVPGNHELWTRNDPGEPRGALEKYSRLVDLCRSLGVVTPEDPYLTWPGRGPPTLIVPMFLHYDYSFGPDDVPRERALAWAAETDTVCSDERMLDPAPFASSDALCEERCKTTLSRLEAIDESARTILVNHYPLLREHAWLPRIPRFALWCGTRRTSDWHRRFRALAVVSGHLHIRATRSLGDCLFEEVLLGYPRDWSRDREPASYLRKILPRG